MRSTAGTRIFSTNPSGQWISIASTVAASPNPKWTRRSFDDAKLPPSAIAYINAHGTSTDLNDKNETIATKVVFGDHAKKLAMSSTKSMTGHTLGAAGALESVFCILALQTSTVPPTINLENLDPACVHPNLNIVANATVEAPLKYALSNSFGFGGTNGCLVFGKV